MRRFFATVLLLVPLAAFAAPCQFEAPRKLQLDLAGVRAVRIELHRHTLHLSGGSDARRLTLGGRACASDHSALAGLKVTTRREGDQLLLDVGGDNRLMFKLFGNSYAYLDITLQLPNMLPVTLSVGSGDAEVSGLQQLQSQVGSGDLHVRQVSDMFGASVGSGDIEGTDIGRLDIGSVGSGDFKAEGIRGDVRIGSIGSGDVVLRKVAGSVRADTLGSGDFSVNDVAGDFSLGAKGSGDVGHSGVKGKVSVPHDDD